MQAAALKFWYLKMKMARSGIVASFWKLITPSQIQPPSSAAKISHQVMYDTACALRPDGGSIGMCCKPCVTGRFESSIGSNCLSIADTSFVNLLTCRQL